MAAVSSRVPPLGDSVLQIVVRLGMPPTELSPGFHTVTRSAAISVVAFAVTVAVSLLDGSATLVATTWYVPAAAGAVYWPDESTLPPPASCTDQVTAVDCPVVAPLTVAAKVTLPAVATNATLGEIVTEIPGGVTVMVA